MSLSPLDSALWIGLYGSADAGARLGDKALIAAMVQVEIALAQACEECGVTPAGTGAQIAERLSNLTVIPEQLATQAARDGVPVPGLLTILRDKLDNHAGEALHWGATSQDIVDTATALCLKAFSADLLAQAEALADLLAARAENEAQTVQLARTRTQGALPTTFGATLADWGEGITEAHDRLAAAQAQIATLSLHGAAGTDGVLGEAADAVRDATASRLDLVPDATSWHSKRTRISSFADAICGLAMQAGRIAADIAFLASTGIGEIRLTGGGSSTLPHKVNPVRAEAAQSLARFASHLQSAVSASAIHRLQRDGVAWGLEWLALRPLCGAASAACSNVAVCLEEMQPDRSAMAANLAAAGFGPFAERLVFLLAEATSRTEAQNAVRQALTTADPVSALQTDHPDIDWAVALDPLAATGAATRRAQAFAASRRRHET